MDELHDKHAVLYVEINKRGNFDNILKVGFQKLKAEVEKQLYFFMDEFARLAAIDAINTYIEKNSKKHQLTGNTQTAFCSMLYENGQPTDVLYIGYQEAGVKRYNYGYVKPGKVNTARGWFTDYGSGEKVEQVMPYSDGSQWGQTTEGGTGVNDTVEFLSSYKPIYKKGFCVVVANARENVVLIAAIHEFDILESAKNNHKKVIVDAINKAKKRI